MRTRSSRYGAPMLTADDVARELGLEPLPFEGGYFRETYRAPGVIPSSAWGEVGDGREGERNFATQIYYMLRTGQNSALHRVASDECFHFYLGDPVVQLVLKGEGTDEGAKRVRIGADLARGERPQHVVAAGDWQGACLASDVPGTDESARHGFALLGCTVAPGFDWRDFELVTAEQAAGLKRRFPEEAGLVGLLTPVEGRERA